VGIANIINNSTTTSGGEIVRELVNSSDGQGLHFESGGYIELANSAAAEFGTSDFSVEFVLNQKEANVSSNNIFRYPSSGDNRMFIQHQSGTTKITFRDTSDAVYDLGYDMAADYGTPTHYVLTADRDGNALLYKNGNQVGSVDISASSSVNIGSGNTGVGAIGSSSANYTMLGTFYRFRTWNKALTSTEVQTAYERADVPFPDQYGRQAVRDGSAISSSNWSNGTGWSFGSGIATFTQSGGTVGAVSQTSVFTSADAGKNVRITFTVGTASATILIGNASGGTDYVGSGYTSYAAGTHTAEFTMPSGETTLGFWANGATFTISNISVHVEGCVSDYDLAFASPTQSLTVQDRAGVADGTASSSTLVTQVQPIIQGNMRSLAVTTTSQASGVPADGDIIVSGGVGVGAAAGAGGHGLTVDKSVADDWVAKIKNSGNTTPYGLQVDCQGSNAVTAFAVYAGSAPNNTSFTIKPSGVVVQGGDVGIGQTPTANFGKLQVYATGDQTDETTAAFSIGDTATGGMRIYGGVNNSNNYAYIGAVESGTSYRELKIQPNGGLTTFANGIALQTSPSNASATANEAYTLDKYETGTFQLADGSGASLTITGGLGRYTRIGDRVFISVQFGMPSVTNGNHMTLEGLPFNTANNDASRGLIISYSGSANVAYSLTTANTDKVSFYTSAGVNASNTNASGASFWLNGHYRTA
jgi:hypothetical protein